MSEGLIGGVVGSLLTMFGNFVLHWLQTRNATKLDEVRKKLLHRMLGTRDWRKLSTLSRVIGADANTTKRLLIEAGARGSEQPRADTEEVWGLISKHPLDQISGDD
jgi:hypothetical protein